MYKIIVLISIMLVLTITNYEIYAQQPRLSTFQETAQVIFDQAISNNVTASITLQSTNNQEIRIPSYLIEKIQDTEEVIAVVITNEEQCVLGVVRQSCVLINIHTGKIEGGVKAIQEEARRVGDSLISDINRAFDIHTKFHSVFIHHRDATNQALETSGVVSGQGATSAVYTMPKEDTKSMYEKLSAILLTKSIRDSGGFYDVATKLSSEDTAGVSVSIIPQGNVSLLQLRLSVDYTSSARSQKNIDPLQFLKVNELKRSEYFSSDFFPLNSLLKVVVLSSEHIRVSNVNTNIVPAIIKDGERLPDFTNDGWFFDTDAGEKIDGTYLFGKKNSIGKNELIFSIGLFNETKPIQTGNNIDSNPLQFDFSQMLVLIGIIIAAVGASIFYLKGYKTKILDK
jgi:hypothetical protein